MILDESITSMSFQTEEAYLSISEAVFRLREAI